MDRRQFLLLALSLKLGRLTRDTTPGKMVTFVTFVTCFSPCSALCSAGTKSWTPTTSHVWCWRRHWPVWAATGDTVSLATVVPVASLLTTTITTAADTTAVAAVIVAAHAVIPTVTSWRPRRPGWLKRNSPSLWISCTIGGHGGHLSIQWSYFSYQRLISWVDLTL